MASTVEATAALVDGITDEEWTRPTGCPGWNVRDTVAHLVGLEDAVVSGVEPDCEVPAYDHVRDDNGRYMERHVEARRGVTPDALIDEYRRVFTERLAALRSIAADAFGADAPGPFGSSGPLDRMLNIRVFDLWAHEQDIRRALGKPGGLDTPAARVSVEQCTRVAGPILGRHMPDGSTLALHLDGPFGGDFAWSFDGGRAARLDEPPTEATVSLSTDTEAFTALCCGRSDARPDAVTIDGDTALGATLVAHLGFTP